MDTSKLTWKDVGQSRILVDEADLVHGTVYMGGLGVLLWQGTAILGPEIAQLPVRPLHPGERLGANLVSYPVTGGRISFFNTKAAAEQFVIDTLTKHKENTP